MKKIKNYFLLIGAFTLVLASCKKYEEGPFISIIPKDERMDNTWKVKNYFENGVDKTTEFNNLLQNAVLKIEKSGTYNFSYKAGGLLDYSESGTWRFINNKEDFETTKTTGISSVSTHHILKLKESELWYYDMDNGVKKEYHLVP